jgi:hypothetical protein
MGTVTDRYEWVYTCFFSYFLFAAKKNKNATSLILTLNQKINPKLPLPKNTYPREGTPYLHQNSIVKMDSQRPGRRAEYL